MVKNKNTILSGDDMFITFEIAGSKTRKFTMFNRPYKGICNSKESFLFTAALKKSIAIPHIIPNRNSSTMLEILEILARSAKMPYVGDMGL